MITVNQKKRALLTSFFFALVLLIPLSVLSDNRADAWYQTGYEYSQAGHNRAAFEWMLRAANAKHPAAQNNIGLSYLHGLGVDKDANKAFIWFEKSAKQGLNYAQSELAMLYYQRGNTRQAYEWWLIAAEQNDEYAQFNLASLLLEKNNTEQAIYWFTRAKNNQHPDAQTALDELKEKLKEKYAK